MTITLLVLLMVAAISLILLEIFVIPGVGIPGVAGIVLMLVCIYFAYTIDTLTGNVTAGSTAVISGILIALSLNANTWQRFSQKGSIDSKVSADTVNVVVGEKGIALSRMNPSGKARFGEEILEVQSRGGYIDANGPVEIIKIDGRKVYIKPVNPA